MNEVSGGLSAGGWCVIVITAGMLAAGCGECLFLPQSWYVGGVFVSFTSKLHA